MYGIYDTDDNLWMGNEAGPLLYEEKDIAMIAAAVTDGVLHQRTGRTRAREWKPAEVRQRDSKELLESPVEVLEKLELGII